MFKENSNDQKQFTFIDKNKSAFDERKKSYKSSKNPESYLINS